MCFIALSATLQQYVPVVFIYGMGAYPEEFDDAIKLVQELYPGIYAVSKKIGQHSSTDSILWPLYRQSAEFARLVRDDPKLAGGFNIITHSQGGIIGRSYVEQYNNPPVRRLITLGSPSGGWFCGYETRCPFPFSMYTGIFEKIALTDTVQDLVGPAGFYRSPYQPDVYLEKNKVLPIIDNEVKFNQTYKDNIISLDYFVMVGAKDDGVLQPYQSAFFGFWQDGNDTVIENLVDREMYKKDLIGLKTLNEQGRLIQIDAGSMQHVEYFDDHKIPWMKENVYKWLDVQL